MKKDNLLTLVKYAKETMTPEEVFDICKENNKTHIIPRNIIEKYSHSEDCGDMIVVASFCNIDTLKYMLKKSEDLDYGDKVYLRATIAINPNCDEEVFDILLETHSALVDSNIAANKYVNQKILSKICSRKRSRIAWEDVVRNRNCSETIFRKLFKNSESTWGIRYQIAKKVRNIDVLHQMYEDKDAYIAYEAAKKLRCVDDFCERLLSSELDADKVMLAKITSSKEVLRELCKCENLRVVCIAIKNNNCPIDVIVNSADSDHESVRISVAQKENVAISLLRKLSEDGSSSVRVAVAKNSNTPIDILEKLSYDAKNVVRAEVAKNPNTSDDTLYRMFVGDNDTQVMYLAAKNIRTYWRFDFKGVLSKRCYYKQIYGYLENENVSKGDLLEFFLDNMYYPNIWMIIYKIVENENADDSTFDRIIEEMASKPFTKDTSEKGVAISTIVGSPNFKQFNEFIELYFNE